MNPIKPIDTNSAHPGTPITEREKWWQAEVERLKSSLVQTRASCSEARTHIQTLIDVCPHEHEGAKRAMACSDARDFLRESTCGTALLEELRRYQEQEQALNNWCEEERNEVPEKRTMDFKSVQEFLRSFKAKHEH